MTQRHSCTNPEIGHLLARYELNLVDEDERERFEQHLLDCSFCQQEILAFLPAINHIHREKSVLLRSMEDRGVTYESLREALLSEESTASRTRQVRRRSVREALFALREWWARPIVWAPAAALATCALLLILVTRPSGHGRYESYLSFESLPFEGTLTRGNSNTELDYYLGVQAYQARNWPAAIAQLKSVTEADSTHGEAWLYLGISYYIEHQAPKAVSALEHAEEWVPRHLSAQSKWYLAQALLLDNKRPEAVAQLKSVASDGGPLAEKASDLLAKLEHAPK